MTTRKWITLLSWVAILTLFGSSNHFLKAQENSDESANAPAPVVDESATGDAAAVLPLAPATDALPDSVTNTVVGHVYTVLEGEDKYIPYANVHASLLQDDRIVAEFTTDEAGAFSLKDVPAGDYTLMAEHESDDAFGSREISIIYDVFHAHTLVLFLNKCGLARFPSDFDPNIVLADNKVKFWDYVNCNSMKPKEAGEHAVVQEQTAAQTYSATPANQGDYYYGSNQYGMSSMGSGWGALGLLGLIGLIGLSGPVSAF